MARTEPAAERFAIRARRIFDGAALLPASRTTVVVDKGLISAIETSGTRVEGHMPVHELGDATLLPGLIDAHTHLVFDASDTAAVNVQSAVHRDLAAAMRLRARAMMDHGITSVRDLGDRDYLSLMLREETAKQPAAGPRIVAAGPPITSTGGHCWFLGCEADDAEAVTAAVDDHALRGVDVIKVMATGGRMTPTTVPHESQYSLKELRVAADRAHFHGLPAAAHVHGRRVRHLGTCQLHDGHRHRPGPRHHRRHSRFGGDRFHHPRLAARRARQPPHGEPDAPNTCPREGHGGPGRQDHARAGQRT
ncbi:amidohydrolase family protein [Arthrobacter sp. SDTb3-6]|nr:amidohydrolase family protein [Arthrobacter sp. SDTb3-6]